MSLIQCHGSLRIGAGPSDIDRDGQGDTLDLLEEDLIQLTIPVSYTREEDIPMCMNHHIRDDRGCFTRLLHKVAHAILCYNEHHHDD